MATSSQLTPLYRFVLIAIISIAVMIIDHRTPVFSTVHRSISYINSPFNALLDVPQRLRRFFEDYWPNQRLLEQAQSLSIENQSLQAKVQKYDALAAEKNRLLVLLSAKQAHGDMPVKLARIIRTALKGAFDQRVVLNLGLSDGVYLHQAVVDAGGVIGQVSLLAGDHSVVTVLTDASHAVPIEVLRNGLRAVARGTGESQMLSVPFMSFQADIKVGDVLVTSGLGEVFPAGHPVAKVVDIKGVAGEAFLTIQAKPLAALDKIKSVLLLGKMPASIKESITEGEHHADDMAPTSFPESAPEAVPGFEAHSEDKPIPEIAQ